MQHLRVQRVREQYTSRKLCCVCNISSTEMCLKMKIKIYMTQNCTFMSDSTSSTIGSSNKYETYFLLSFKYGNTITAMAAAK